MYLNISPIVTLEMCWNECFSKYLNAGKHFPGTCLKIGHRLFQRMYHVSVGNK